MSSLHHKNTVLGQHVKKISFTSQTVEISVRYAWAGPAWTLHSYISMLNIINQYYDSKYYTYVYLFSFNYE